MVEALGIVWSGRIAIVWDRSAVVRVCAKEEWLRPTAKECDAVLEALLLDAGPDGVTAADVAARLRDLKLDRPL